MHSETRTASRWLCATAAALLVAPAATRAEEPGVVRITDGVRQASAEHLCTEDGCGPDCEQSPCGTCPGDCHGACYGDCHGSCHCHTCSPYGGDCRHGHCFGYGDCHECHGSGECEDGHCSRCCHRCGKCLARLGDAIYPHDGRLGGCYGLAYPVDPWYFDQRDGQVYAAYGHGMPMSVPLAPTVNYSYNYGWGVPSSRITPLSRMPGR